MPASITLTVSHLPTSTSFFLSTLQPLNYVYRGRVDNTIGFGHPDAAPDFWITQSIPGVPPGPAHVAFPALSRGNVHDFFHAALKAGGKVHGEPALRDECGYYSAAIIDFDGNSIEAVFRPDLISANKEAAADAKSVASMTKSVAKSKAPTAVSSASKMKSAAPSKVASVAPSAAAKSTTSKAPSKAPSAAPSRAPSATPSRASSAARSKAPSQAAASMSPPAAPPKSTVSKAPTAAASEAPARTTISRAPTAPAAPQGAGNGISNMINEAKDTVAFAREVVTQARGFTSSPPAQNVGSTSSPDSHGPSDAIVGTLLGVAAGAALHYAFSHRKGSNEAASAPVTPPERYTARSETLPSWSEERYYYYHQNQLPGQTPYAIEPAGSEFSRLDGSRASGQRMIEMVDNDPAVSEYASTMRPRRRSSFSGVSASRSSASRAQSGMKMLEAPPTSYRSPTAMTAASSSRRSRASSVTRAGADEGYASATDDRRTKISVVRGAPSAVSKAPTTATAKPSAVSRRSSHHRGSTTSSRPASGSGSRSGSTVVTAIRSAQETPLPPSRAATHIDDGASFHTTHSKSHKTVIGRLTEKQLSKLEQGGRFDKGQTDVTKSVIGKIKDIDKMNLTRKELGPDDSVSQVSSNRSSRR